MRHSRSDLRKSFFAAWSLVVLVAVAGCSNDPAKPPLDTVSPQVSSTNPFNGAIGVAVITASFSEAMDASTINLATFTLRGPGATPVAGSVSYSPSVNIASFSPTNVLALNTTYTATVTTGARDVGGNPLVNDHVWSFTTTPTTNQTSPELRGAGAFVVLAGSTVANLGATALTGDLGVSPGTSVTGFPPGIFSGSLHVGDPTSAMAMADLTTAYNDAAGRTVSPVTLAGNIGGLTLPPGLYKSTSSLSISSGDLTLDAHGDPNAVFIFQMASTLTTTSGRAIILSGGAKSSNVFWQVGSSATLGTTSVFKGTIMADQSITLASGATINGRALARIGAVTLADNSAVMPTP